MNLAVNFNINKNRTLWIVSIIGAILLLWLSISNLDFTRLINLFSEINYPIIILSLLPAFISLITQTFRWQVTFSNFGQKANFWDLFRSMSIGNAFNNILPKGGEFIKPYIYSSRSGLKYTSVLATVGIDRFYDFIGMLLFMMIILTFNRENLSKGLSIFNPELLLVLMLILAFLIFLVLYKIAKNEKKPRMVNKLVGNLPNKFQDFINEKIEYFRKGLHSVSSLKLNLKLLFWTIVSWLFHSLNLYIAFFAFDFQGDLQLSYFDAMTLLIAISIGITVLPVPGGTGVQHYVVKVLLMNLFGIEAEIAIAYASINHASIFFLNLANGIVCIIPERKYLFKLKN